MSLLKVNEIQVFNGTTVTITATTTETSADLNVGADLDVTGALTLGTALAIAEGGTGATDAATARTNLDVDQAGTDNSTDVTLVTTSHDYLSIAGQAITLGPIDLTADVTGTLPVSSGGTGVTSLGSLDAADLGSGAATDGYVLTADGAGNAAWEAASGGGVSLPIDLLSSGASIRKSDGTTAVLSESSGDVTLSAKNIVIANGGGIDFSADSNATGMSSEILDDYEEGTWSPQYADAESGGNQSSGTGGNELALYTKIGRVVNLQLLAVNISMTGLTSGNDFYIRNLPFNSNSTIFYRAPGSVSLSVITYSNTNLSTELTNGASAFRISETISGGTLDYVTVSQIPHQNNQIQISITYFT